MAASTRLPQPGLTPVPATINIVRMSYLSEYRKHGVWGGSDIPKHTAEINQVKGALNAIGISIDQYMDKTASGTYGGVMEVTGNPKPTGIKFFCKDPAGLTYRIRQLGDQLKPDDRSTAAGFFNAARATGDSYREKGLGMRLHIEVGSITDCHLDSHQIAAGSAPGMGTLYDFDSIADHFTFDLGPELPILQWLYFPLGRHASIGPYFTMKMNRPDPKLHDPRGGPDGGLDFGAGVSVRGTFGSK